jgi:hypothetical protein
VDRPAGPWRRRVVAGLLVVAAAGFAVVAVVDRAEQQRLDDDGIEVVAEVLGHRHPRSMTGYEVAEVAFTTREGRPVRTEVQVQDRIALDVTPVRYDPEEPERARSVDDPAVLWLEDAILALVLGIAAAVVANGPRLRAWRHRLDGEGERPVS